MWKIWAVLGVSASIMGYTMVLEPLVLSKGDATVQLIDSSTKERLSKGDITTIPKLESKSEKEGIVFKMDGEMTVEAEITVPGYQKTKKTILLKPDETVQIELIKELGKIDKNKVKEKKLSAGKDQKVKPIEAKKKANAPPEFEIVVYDASKNKLAPPYPIDERLYVVAIPVKKENEKEKNQPAAAAKEYSCLFTGDYYNNGTSCGYAPPKVKRVYEPGAMELAVQFCDDKGNCANKTETLEFVNPKEEELKKGDIDVNILSSRKGEVELGDAMKFAVTAKGGIEPYTITWTNYEGSPQKSKWGTASKYPLGEQTVKVQVCDTSTPVKCFTDDYTFNVVAEPPTKPLIQMTPETKLKENTFINFTAKGAKSKNSTVSYEWSLNNRVWSKEDPDGTFSPGSHTVFVRAIDENGIVSQTESKSFEVENIPPSKPTIGIIPEPVNELSLIAFTAENVKDYGEVQIKWSWDQKTWVNNPPNGKKNPGTYTIYAKAFDAYNEASDTASKTFTVENLLPSAPVIEMNPAASLTQGTDVIFTASGSVDPAGQEVIYEWSKDGITWSRNKVDGRQGPGDQKIYARAVDPFKGASPATEKTFYVEMIKPTTPTIVLNPETDSEDPNTNIKATQVISFEATSSESATGKPVTYLWKIGDEEWAAKAPNRKYEPGTHIVYVKAKDEFGTESDISQRIFNVDFVPPTEPIISMTPTQNIDDTKEVTFKASGSIASNDKEPKYEWSLDGIVWSETVPNGTFTPGTHRVYARAIDEFGNPSNASEKRFTVRGTPPSAPEIKAMPEADWREQEEITFSGTGAVSKSGGAVTYEWSLDGTTFSAVPPNGVYNPGNLTVYLRAIDEYGTSSPVVSKKLNIQNTPPSNPIIVLDPSSEITEEVTVRFSAIDSTDVDGQQVTYLWSLDGNSWSETVPDKQFVPKTHKVYVKARDSFGGESTIVEKSFVVENVPPTTPTITITPATDIDESHTVQFTADGSTDSNGAVKYEWSLDGTSWSLAAPNGKMKPNNYTVYVRAIDTFGAKSLPASKTFVVRNLKPSTPTLTMSPNDNPVSETEFLTFAAAGSTDPGGNSVTYEWSKDGLLWEQTLLDGQFKPGTYTISVRAVDKQGLASDPVSVSFEVFNAPPTDPSISITPANSWTEATTIEFEGKNSTDGSGNIIYEYSLDGTTFSTLPPNGKKQPGTYTIYVRAKDESETYSNTVSKTFNVANVNPTKPSIAMSPNSNLTESSNIIFFASGSTDASGQPVSYKWSLDGVNWTDAPPNGTYPTGTHVVRVRAEDAHSGRSEESFITFTTENLPPTQPSIIMTPGTNLNEGTMITFTNTESTDASGYAPSYEWSLDGIVWSSTPFNQKFNPGTHTVYLRAIDNAGAASGVDSVTFTVTDAPPSAPTINLNPATGPYSDGTMILISATGSVDPGGSNVAYEYSTDNATWTNAAPSGQYNPGSHTVYARARDAAGNYSAVTSTSFTVTNTPPTQPTITATVPNNVPENTTITFNASGSTDTNGSVTYEWSEDGGTTWSSSAPNKVFTVGSHAIMARAVDQHNLTSTISTYTLIVQDMPPNQPNLTYSPMTNIDVSTNMTFIASGSVDPGGTAVTYEWRLDNGTWSASAPNGTKTAGAHTVYVRAKDAANNTSTVESVTFTVVDNPPTKPDLSMNPSPPATINNGTTITFTPSGSVDDSGSLTYKWKKDNGLWVTTNPSGTFSAGSHTVCVRAEDGAGGISPQECLTFNVAQREHIVTEDFEDTAYNFTFTYSPANAWVRRTTRAYTGAASFASSNNNGGNWQDAQFTVNVPAGAWDAQLCFYHLGNVHGSDQFYVYENGSTIVNRPDYQSSFTHVCRTLTANTNYTYRFYFYSHSSSWDTGYPYIDDIRFYYKY